MTTPATETVTESNTLSELAQARAAARAKVKGEKETAAAPKVEVAPEPDPVTDPVTDPASDPANDNPPGAATIPQDEPEETIRIGDKVFKTQSEAIKYAEQLERDKEIAEAHALGVQEALKVTQAQMPQSAPVKVENFEEKFYTDPKGTLEEIKKSAVREATAQIQAETQRETLWNQFFNEYPDLAGQRKVCELVLAENWNVLGQMTDTAKAMKLLATKTRSIFQDYAEKARPRKELPNVGGPVVSQGTRAGAPGVTPKKETENEKLVDFVSQLKQARRR